MDTNLSAEWNVSVTEQSIHDPCNNNNNFFLKSVPIDIPYDVLVKLVEFLYNSGVGTGFEMNSSFQDAFKKLELFDCCLDPEEDLHRAIYEAMMAPPTRQHNDANDDSDNDELYETFPQIGVGKLISFEDKHKCS